MNRTRLVAVCAIAALTGCATNRLSREMQPYVGRNVHDLEARLGQHNGERETTGDRVYVWSADSDGVLPATPISTGSSSGAEISYAGSATRAGTMSVAFQCTLEVTINRQNIIERYEVEGSDAGCAKFRRIPKP